MKTKSKGAFVQASNGTWNIDTKVKVGEEFKHFKRTGYETLSAAKADFERAKVEFIKSKEQPKCEVVFFEDLIGKYKEKRKIEVNITTYLSDNSSYNVYLYPYFKGKLLKDVFNKESIEKWYHSIVDSVKLSTNKKSKLVSRMKDILQFAYMHKYIDAIVYQDCDVCMYKVKCDPRAKKNQREVWDEEEERAFMEVIKGFPKDNVMFRVFFSIGARLGEFLGLQGKSFNYQKNTLKIEQQVLNIEGEGAILTDQLKTHESYRTIILTKDICEMLKNYIDEMGIGESDFIFFGCSKDVPISRTTFRRKLYHYCELANVKKIVPHSGRHLVATKLSRVAKNHAELEVAAKYLGHSPEMFMNTYARHSNEETEKELLERMASA